MKTRANRELAEATAAQVIKDFGITTLPVDPIDVAKKKGMLVQELPSSSRGVSGLLLSKNGSFGIMYATHIKSAGFQRFSVAHELGHYFIPGHIEAVLGEGGTHQSRAGFAESDPYELEADHFAAALLMPTTLCQAALRKAEYGLEGVSALADACQTSLSASAIRYCGLIKLPVAVIQSEGNRVDFCFMSKDLEEYRNLRWPTKGSGVPTATHTFDFNQSRDRIANSERWSEEISLGSWFGSFPQVAAVEDIVGLGSYGKSLTIVWTETFADEVSEDGAEQGEWKPKFAYGR
jgi:Zn-dependent peptidase ImmA (M78 family)